MHEQLTIPAVERPIKDAALVEFFNAVERSIRDLRRVQHKAINLNLPGIRVMIEDRIERMKRERVYVFTNQDRIMLLSHGRKAR